MQRKARSSSLSGPGVRTIALGWKEEEGATTPNGSAEKDKSTISITVENYADCDSFENELDEFFGLGDVQIRKDCAKESCGDEVVMLETLLEGRRSYRIQAARALLYVALGRYESGSAKDKVTLSAAIVESNAHLLSLGAFSYYRAALKLVSSQLEALIANLGNSSVNQEDLRLDIENAHYETTLYLSLLYLLITANHNDPELVEILCECDPDAAFDPPPSAASAASASSNSEGTSTGNGFVKAKSGRLPFAIELFEIVSVLAEGNRKLYPVKKLLLLLWKVLLVTVGNSEALKELKNAGRAREGLPPAPQDTYAKATPQDFHNFNLLTTQKYPAYFTPSISDLKSPALIPDPLSSVARRAIINPLPPPSSNAAATSLQGSSANAASNSNPLSNDGGLSSSVITSTIQPVASDSLLPCAFEESLDLLYKKMYIGLREVQISREIVELEGVKRRAAEGVASGTGAGGFDFPSTGGGVTWRDTAYKGQIDLGLQRVEELYRYLSPNITIHIGMLIRLLYYVNLGNELNSKNENSLEKVPSPLTDDQVSSVDASASSQEDAKSKHQDALEAADVIRHREMVTKAISGILLILLKSIKCDDVLKFEYICQLLVDNNCAILILKMLSIWFQNPVQAAMAATTTGGAGTHPERSDSLSPAAAISGANLLKERDDPKELNFFDAILGTTSVTTSQSPKDPQTLKGSWRNFFTTINLLRILQKITKRKTHRVMALVQWKASAVLKRIIKVPNARLQTYALKLLKSQIPLLGKKWRSSNMKVITSIYLHLRPNLVEEYLSGDSDTDADEALTQEQYLRSLIACFHHRVYPEIYPPPAPVAPAPGDGKESQPNFLHDSGHDELESVIASTKIAGSHNEGGYGGSSNATFLALLGRNRYAEQVAKLHRNSSTTVHPTKVDPDFEDNYQTWLHEEIFGDAASFSPLDSDSDQEDVFLERSKVPKGVGYGISVPVIVDEFDWPFGEGAADHVGTDGVVGGVGMLHVGGDGFYAPAPTPMASPGRNKYV
ncbi:Factor arrest protein 11 [Chytriomyces hyalinus]|nr:Factor arrest protein 11 [Chytriomyces hyalinus]